MSASPIHLRRRRRFCPLSLLLIPNLYNTLKIFIFYPASLCFRTGFFILSSLNYLLSHRHFLSLVVSYWLKGLLFRLMGLLFFTRKASFNLIEVSLCRLGLSRNCFMIKNNSFYKLYRGASSVSLSTDSDSGFDTDSSPNGDCNNLVGELLVSRKQLLRNNKGFVRLSSTVVKVLKSLNWEAARLLSFKRAVRQFGFCCAFDAFRMILYIFASAEMSNKVIVMLRSMIYNYSKGGAKFNLLDFLLNFPIATNVIMVDALVKVFAFKKMFEDAFDVYKSAKEMGICPGIRSCNFLLKCLLENDSKDFLLALFKDMKNTGPSPNVFTYTIMMNFYCNGKFGQRNVDMVEANNILHEMKSNGISPTMVTYGTYFKGLARGGYAEAAVNLMHDLICDSQPIDVYCCNAVIDVLFRKEKLDEAMEIFEEMPRCKIAPNVYTYNILVRGLCEIGEIEKAILILEEMEKNSNTDLKPTLVTYIPLLETLCKSGRVEASLQLFHDVCNRGYELDPIAYNQGNTDFARKLLNDMIISIPVPLRDGKIYVHLANVIADGYCKKGFVKKAWEYLVEMRYKGVELNIISYGIIIKWLCKEGNSEKSLMLIPLMMKSNMLPNVVIFTTLISGFTRELNIKMALAVFRNMRKFSVCPNKITYTILISFYLSKDNVETAYNLFEEMIQTGEFPDEVIYTTWVSWFSKRNDMEKAYMWFKEMDRQGCFPTRKTYNILAHGFFKQRRIDKAMEVIEEMKTRGVSPDVITYNVMIYGFLMMGEKDLAQDILVNMKKNGVLPNAYTYTLIVHFGLGYN